MAYCVLQLNQHFMHKFERNISCHAIYTKLEACKKHIKEIFLFLALFYFTVVNGSGRAHFIPYNV